MEINSGGKKEILFVKGEYARLMAELQIDGAKPTITITPQSSCPFYITNSAMFNLLSCSEEQIKELGIAMLKLAERMHDADPTNITMEDLNSVWEDCEVCDRPCEESELIDGVCEDCIDELAEKLEKRDKDGQPKN